MSWREFDYLIASAATECPFEIADEMIRERAEMAPLGQWLIIPQADAMLIVLDDVQGLEPTDRKDLYRFTQSRMKLDEWMTARHPTIGYLWVDQFAVAFADRESQASFDRDLGERVVRARPLR